METAPNTTSLELKKHSGFTLSTEQLIWYSSLFSRLRPTVWVYLAGNGRSLVDQRLCRHTHPSNLWRASSFNSFTLCPTSSTLIFFSLLPLEILRRPFRSSPSLSQIALAFDSSCFDLAVPAIGHISYFYPTLSQSGVTNHNRQNAAQEG
jgi:hypothetical protein